MNKILFSLFLLSMSANLLWADDTPQVFTLKDGSQIKGVLSSVDNGVYTVKTPIIGDVHINASDVASITNGNAAPAPALAAPTGLNAPLPASGSNMDAQIAASQQQLMANPQSMAILQQMAQDPDISQALQDPALVQAVTSHDYQAVQSNPRVQELMSNPKMQQLIKQLAAQQQQQTTPSQ